MKVGEITGHGRGGVPGVAHLRPAGGPGARCHLPGQPVHEPEAEHHALLGKPNFEFIRHDVTDPILLEVDEI